MHRAKNFFRSLLILTTLILVSCDREENPSHTVQPAPEPQFQGTIIALGDSLTAGLGVAESDAWPTLLENKLHQHGFNWRVINAGISGETSSGALARINWILAQEPDIVILETGGNDGLRGIPTELIRKNISKAVQMLKEEQVTVVLAGMQIVQNLGPEYTDSFTTLYPDIAEEQKILLIPFFLQDVAGEPDLNQPDLIHPNEKGHGIIVETVYPLIVKAVQKIRKQQT